MTRNQRTWVWGSVGIVGLGLAGALTAHRLVIERVEGAMAHEGLTWDDSSHDWLRLEWRNVDAPVGSIGVISFDAIASKLTLGAITVDLSKIDQADSIPSTQRPSSTEHTAPQERDWDWPDLRINITDVTVLTGDKGPLNGPIKLTSEPDSTWTASTTGDANEWTVQGNQLTLLVNGQAYPASTLALTASPQPRIHLRVPGVAIEDPRLSREALPPHELTVDARINRAEQSVLVDAKLGPIAAQVGIKSTDGGVEAEIEIPPLPLTDVAAFFGSTVPESEQMELSGTVGLKANVAGPPWVWSATPSTKDLTAKGRLPGNLKDDQVHFNTGEQRHVVGPSIHGWTPLAQAGWMPEAAIAAEDIRFMTHPGYDLEAIQEAIEAAPNEDRIRGGSTITQQLSKNLFLDGRRTLRRKFRELLLALALEDRMTKDGILQLYLNIVEFGPNIRGIDSAADAWFLKEPGQLSPREAAFLAAILPAPHGWHERIKRTGKPPVQLVDRVLDRMRRKGVLSADEHRRAKARRLRIVPP